MFGKLYLGELKKLLRPKSILIICVLFLVFFILFAIVYNVNWDAMLDSMTGQMTEEELNDFLESINANDLFKNVTAQTIDKDILAFENSLALSLKNKDGSDYFNRGVISILKYIKANDLYGQDFTVIGYNNIEKSAENFLEGYMSAVLLILEFFAITVCVGIYADEYKNGTIKLVSIRPISRPQLTFAKMLSMFTVLIGIYFATIFVAYLYGLAAFGSASATKCLMLFNARSVNSISLGGYMALKMMFDCISLATYGLIAFSLGAIFKKKTPAIIFGLILLFGILGNLLGMIPGLNRFLLSPNIDLSPYLSLSSILPYKANFFISISMLLVYSAIFYVSTFLITQKRDIV